MNSRYLVVPALGVALLASAWAMFERSEQARLTKEIERLKSAAPVTGRSRTEVKVGAWPALDTRPPVGEAGNDPSAEVPGSKPPKTPKPSVAPDQVFAMLRGTDAEQRKAAIQELYKSKDRAPHLATIQWILTGSTGDKEIERLRYDAVKWLEKIKGPEAASTAAVVMLGQDPGYVRRRAADVLGKIGDASSVPLLKQAYEGSDLQMKETAFGAMKALGDPGYAGRFFVDVTAAAGDGDSGLREDALEALGRMRDPSIVPVAAAAIVDASSRVREEAARAMGRSGSPTALPYLEKLLSDPNESVRGEAAGAIDRITNPRP